MKLELDELIRDCADRQLRWDGIVLAELCGLERAAWVRDQHLALIVEVVEVMGAWVWKPWAAAEHQGQPVLSRDQCADELADILFFLGNIMALHQFTSSELSESITRKRAKIEARQVSNQYRGDGSGQ